MANYLVIVESPTKAKTIGQFLGSDYTVVSSMGHVRDLPKSKFGVDVDNDFELQYQTPSKAQKVLKELRKEAKDKDVILATDEDREGESISWHLAHALKIPTEDTKRIVFHEITDGAIKHALDNPRTIDKNLVDAQQARRALDRIVGYKLSPFLWKKIRYGLSAGRVQSVALRLVVEREQEIEQFEAQEYWSIQGTFDATDKTYPLQSQLSHINGKKLQKFAYTDEEDVNALLSELRECSYEVTNVEKKVTKTRPYPPYITSTLQQDAARRLYFNARQTMRLAQQLYEGITIGKKGQTGLITYMRTDSVNMSKKAVKAGREVIDQVFGPQYLTNSPRNFTSKSQNAQEAHEAIRPTHPELTPQNVKPYLGQQQYKLYDLIWRRFMATQMKEAEFNAQTVTIEDSDEHVYRFTAKGSVMKFAGFMESYPIRSNDTYLPDVSEGESVDTNEIVGHQHFTQPPGRYTESSLVKMLEKYEIGRPSTYATIISTIEDRGYVEKNDQKRFYPTDTGRIVNDMLVTHFPNIVDVQFTAQLENQLDEVAEGNESYSEMLRQFYEPFIEHLEEREQNVDKYAYILSDRTCPQCGSAVEMKLGKFGKFIACTQYPDCDFKDKTEEEKQFDQQFEGEECPECGAEMQVRRGRYGPFLGCSRYPECKGMKKIEYKVGKTCPECGEGDMVIKKSKKGRTFHACNRYPECKYVENPSKKDS